MRFYKDMTCCKPDRVAIGLNCNDRELLVCAWHELRGAAKVSPIRAEKLLCDLLDLFTPQDLLPGVRSAGCGDSFIAVAAKWCAALPDIEQRRLYLAGFDSEITREERERFVGLLTREWERTRGRRT